MKCPKCGSAMKKEKTIDTVNYIKRKLICKSCNHHAVTYEFLSEDVPEGFLMKGTRVLIGDNDRDVVPGFYLTSLNSLYPHIVIDDDGKLQGKRIISIAWGVKEL